MPDKKITNLTELTNPATGDYIPIVDVSDTTDDSAGTTKKIQKANLISSENQNWVDVSDYGATGDGVTDDTSAINAAIAALPAYSAGSGGGIVFFPEGRYKITSTIYLTDGVVLMGMTNKRPFIFGNVAGPLFATTDGGGSAPTHLWPGIKGFFLYNSDTNGTTYQPRILGIYTCSGFILENCTLQAQSGVGAYFHESHSIHVKDCFFGGSDGLGGQADWCLFFDTNANNVIVEANHFEDAKGGLAIWGGQGVEVINNHFENLGDGTTNYNSISFQDSVKGGTVMGNYFEACNQAEILFYDPSGYFTGFTIGGNYMTNCKYNFIFAQGLRYSTINSNYCEPSSNDANPNGVYLDTRSSNNVIMPQYLASGSGAALSNNGTDNTKVGTW